MRPRSAQALAELRTDLDVFTKDEAYATALRCGAHLSEHGGTGQGVIGALAGVALRLGGNDGRFKGRLHVPSADGVTSVNEIQRSGIDEVRSLDGEVLAFDTLVYVGEAVKPVLLDSMSVLLVVPADDSESVAWKACDRKTLKNY